MEIEPKLTPNIVLSDFVLRDQATGKYTLVGTFDEFNLPAFPFQPPPFFVTVSLSSFRGRLQRYKISISIEEKASGEIFAHAIGEITSSAEVKPTDTIQIPFQLTGQFKSQGVHTVAVSAGNKRLGSREFLVSLKPSGAAQS